MNAYILVDFDGDLLDISLDEDKVEKAKSNYSYPDTMYVRPVDITDLLKELEPSDAQA